MLSQIRKNELMEASTYLATTLIIINKVLDNKISMSDAARQLGMSQTTFQHYLERNFKPYVKNIIQFSADELEGLYAELETPSHRILRAVFDLKSPSVEFPAYDESIFYNEYMKSLRPNQENIILYLYGDNENNETHNMAEAGKKFNVTRERIRQLHNKALFHLRKPKNIAKLYPKVYEKNQAAKDALNEIEDIIQNMALHTKTMRGDAKSRLMHNPTIMANIKSLIHEIETGIPLSEEESTLMLNSEIVWKSIKISNLDLHTRTYRCLERCNVDTVYDLTKFTCRRDIMNIPNAGVKTTDEIIDIIHTYHLPFKE